MWDGQRYCGGREWGRGKGEGVRPGSGVGGKGEGREWGRGKGEGARAESGVGGKGKGRGQGVG